MHLKKKKEVDCYSFFLDEMQLVKLASDHLCSVLKQYRSSFPCKDLSVLERLKNQGDSTRKQLLQNTLASFIPPLERKDIVRFSGSLLSILNSLSDSAHTVSVFPNTVFFSETGGYISLLEDCCRQLGLLLSKLSQKRELSFLLSQTEGLHQYAHAGKRRCSSCLLHLCQDTRDAGQLFIRYRLYMSLLSIFECYEDSAGILDEIFCDY